MGFDLQGLVYGYGLGNPGSVRIGGKNVNFMPVLAAQFLRKHEKSFTTNTVIVGQQYIHRTSKLFQNSSFKTAALDVKEKTGWPVSLTAFSIGPKVHNRFHRTEGPP
jgi:hypothetical protein